MRRYYEVSDDVGLEYNLLASLFKKRPVPTIQAIAENREMTSEEKEKAEENIRIWITGFDYDSLVKQVSNETLMKEKFFATDVGYEKIQLFRIVRESHEDDAVITKFINESYHIENEYVMQLNPHKFESVPEYVVDECNRLLESA